MEWIIQTLNWYVYLFVLGLLFFPLMRRFFPFFFDKGYAFSKTIALLFVTYVAFLAGIAHLLPFTRLSLFLIVGIFCLLNFWLYREHLQKIFRFYFKHNTARTRKQKNIEPSPLAFSSRQLFIYFIEEIIFIAGLFFLAYVRGQEPSIHGLEKFMDFGFMNSILRSQYFPPLDMWLSADPSHPQGYPINYYYFGHLSGALLIRLTGTNPFVGYNLVLATILAQSAALVFALVTTIISLFQTYITKKQQLSFIHIIILGLVGSFIVNFGGNLHTVYLFTNGYEPEHPVPFWQILSWFNPSKYWYPNATRFIPFTIHEFPSYSYVVADLHGHVFDIPFVLVTLGLLLKLLLSNKITNKDTKNAYTFITRYSSYILTGCIGFMAAVHYMTNAFDGPIYILLTALFLIFVYKISLKWVFHMVTLVVSFIVFSFPFSYHFSPFVSGVGVNCSPDFLVKLQKLGPFLFEKGNCQISAWWMLLILWGFFLAGLLILLTVLIRESRQTKTSLLKLLARQKTDLYAIILFGFGFFLITIPEFFYIKDIYPAHFRANTMFKLGYQAFIMMGIATIYAFYRTYMLRGIWKYALKAVFVVLFMFVAIYPYFAFPSYYGDLKKTPNLDGSTWLLTSYPADKEIINYLNSHIKGQPVVLEGQGDSYTDYERISANTGLPTIAGWLVHEWLWRGSADVVGQRAPEIQTIYETSNNTIAQELLKKYHVKYVVISQLERDKYKQLNEKKFEQIGKKVFESSDKSGALYQVN